MYRRQPGDDIVADDTRLKYRWQWSRVASGYTTEELEGWTHFQVSKCEAGQGWTLEAVQWADGYEAVVNYNGRTIVSGQYAKTRLKAQLLAEELLVNWIGEQYREVG